MAKVSTDRLTEGASMSRHVKNFFVTAENGLPIKYNKGKKEIIVFKISKNEK